MAKQDECYLSIIGRLGRDPEVKTINEKEATVFSVAVNSIGRDRAEETTWFNVTVFGRKADACQQYLSKGSQVYVRGQLKAGLFKTQGGETRLSLNINADSVQFLDSRQASNDTNEVEPSFDPNEEIPF